MELDPLYREHLRQRLESYKRVLSETKHDGIVLSSGVPFIYFHDDQEPPFQPNPHFAHWCPERSPHHLLHVRTGDSKPTLVFYSPDDYWYEPPSLAGTDWAKHFDIVLVKDKSKRWDALGTLSHHAFIGPEEEEARSFGLTPNPKEVITRLDWLRAIKSPYEVACLQQANAIAAHGHKATKKEFSLFAQTGSELSLHLNYLIASDCREEDLSYTSIIGLNEKSAFLHYHSKRPQVSNPQTLLIDCGARFRGYAADITRSYAKSTAHPVFQQMLLGLETLQLELCNEVKAGVAFRSLHKLCHQKIASLLLQLGVLKNCDADSALARGLTFPFLPHGLGHMLGLQVHDVAGRQINELGDDAPVDPEFPRLRTLRALRENEVVTIEPGIYFIPILLNGFRAGEHSSSFNWPLIDALIPFGGSRIEDNVVVLAKGHENLTRKVLP